MGLGAGIGPKALLRALKMAQSQYYYVENLIVYLEALKMFLFTGLG